MFSRCHPLRFPLILVAALLLSACSATQIAYENADVLLTRYATKKLDLDRHQRERLSEQLALWLVWHRIEQLPRFHARLSALQRTVATGIESRDADWLIARWTQSHFRRHASHLVGGTNSGPAALVRRRQ